MLGSRALRKLMFYKFINLVIIYFLLIANLILHGYINSSRLLVRKYEDTCLRAISVQSSKPASPRAVSFEEQIMSKDEYPSIFFCQMYRLLWLLSLRYLLQHKN